MQLTREAWRQELAAQAALDKLSNWGEWGPTDQSGAAHYIDLNAIRRGIEAIKNGKTYALGEFIGDPASPIVPGLALDHRMLAPSLERRDELNLTWSNDTITMAVHGTTHVDALAHVAAGLKTYNDRDLESSDEVGLRNGGIENLPGLVTRGILLDMVRYRGSDVLDRYDYFTEDDLVGCAKLESVSIEPGDAVLVHTGWRNTFADSVAGYAGPQPGVGSSAALYLARRHICLIGADNTAVNPKLGTDEPDPRASIGSLHVPYLRNLGIYILEVCNLSGLATDRVYEFLFCLAPLRIRGATGSPVNPLAVS